MRKGFTLIELMIVIAIIAIIAAIAIPNLLESRVTANEGAASATLKSGVFAAQVAFQGGAYLDRDLDNVGEWGTLRMLGGLQGTNKFTTGQIKCLTGPLAVQNNWTGTNAALTQVGVGNASGYKYGAMVGGDTDPSTEITDTLIFEHGTAITAPAINTTCSANAGEKYWAVGAIPSEYNSTGRRVFAITSDGQIRSPANPAVVGGVMTGTANSTFAVSDCQSDGRSVARALGGLFNTVTSSTDAANASAVATDVTFMDGGKSPNIMWPTYSK